MAVKFSSYLKRNRFGVLYFRRVIPPELLPCFSFREISRSTRTCNLHEARLLALSFCASVDLLFTGLRDMKKRESGTIAAELIVAVEFNSDGTLKGVTTDAKPEEATLAGDLAAKIVSSALNAGTTTALVTQTRLFEQIDKYLDEQSRGGHWRPQSVLDIRGDFDQFKAILGDMPVRDLGHERLNFLRDTLSRLPANINKMAATRGKSVEEILALDLPPQSASTVRKKWGRVITFCGWLEGRGLIDRNFAKGKKPRAKAQSYEKFSSQDLKSLFESAEYRTNGFKEAFQYWLPVLGLFTGARLEEIAQLQLADIKQDDDTGIWFIEITVESNDESEPDSKKSLKNSASRRFCPIHPTILTAGLLSYVEALKSSGFTRLFPELVADEMGKVGPRASEWFTEYRRLKGVGAATGKSRKVFHSFRHTMNSALQRAGVTQELRESLCGHAPQGINARVYGDQLGLAALQSAIETLAYDIQITPYMPAAQHEKARIKGAARAAKRG